MKEQTQSKRTVHLTMFLAVLVLAVALFAKDATIAGYAFAALAFLAVPPAARHAVGDLALGGGVKGAWKVLTTEAKPAEPPPGGAP